MALSKDIREKVVKAIAGGMSRRQPRRGLTSGPSRTAVRWGEARPTAKGATGYETRPASRDRERDATRKCSTRQRRAHAERKKLSHVLPKNESSQ